MNEETVNEEVGSVLEDEAVADSTSGFHPVNVAHLVMGVAFVGLTLAWAVLAFTDADLDNSRWLLPLPWVLAGVAGLLASVLRPGRGRP